MFEYYVNINITCEDIGIAEAMLLVLFDLSEATFNSHALTHLAEQVRGHGPLILHSAFVFESMLAHLKILFHGTCGILDQICKKLAIAQHAEHHVFNAVKGNSQVEGFAEKLLRSNCLKDTIALSNNVCFFGPLQVLTVTQEGILKAFQLTQITRQPHNE